MGADKKKNKIKKRKKKQGQGRVVEHTGRKNGEEQDDKNNGASVLGHI